MSLPRYPEYKVSGVAWLGTTPSHWTSTRLKFLLAGMGSGGTPDTNASQYWAQDGNGTPWVSIGDLSDREIIRETAKTLTPEGVASKGLSVWPAGTLLFSMYASLGHTAELAMPASTNQAILALHPAEDVNQRFLSRWLEFLKPRLKEQASSNTQDNLNAEKVKNLVVLRPPLPEQTAIATFLDRETENIDTLISEQEKLLTLLAEKRQATISHAVTKGLNPDAPMKDLGVAWLGEVPEHWRVTRLKYATSLIVDCPHETPTYDEDGQYKVIRTSDVSEGRLTTAGMYSVSESEYLNRIRRQSLICGDIVYGREGERWGFAAQVPESGLYCLGQRMMQFRASAETCARYLMWQLNAVSTYRQGQIDTVGATSPHVNVGTIRNYVLAEPPLDEQKEISAFLDAETTRLDALDLEATRAIVLLKERRSALIAAAVTGQIDVRQA